MYKFVLKRILFLIPTILGVTLIIYSVMNITPGNPGQAILGTGVSQEDIDAYNDKLGYNDPFLKKYVCYVKNMVFKGDFGVSYVTKQDAVDEIMPRFKITVQLAVLGVVLSAVIGIPLGIKSAVEQYKLWDTIPSLVAFFLAAVPSFVLGLVLLYLFCLKLNCLPSYGLESWKSYIMPALCIAVPPAAQNFRFTKSSMLEAIRQDYVRTARAKGVPERSVIWKHVLKNALLPVITQLGLSLGVLIAGAVVSEKMFSIPGIGALIVDRISYKDEPVIIAGTILIAICFTIVMLLVDIAYAYVDPRIRSKYIKAKK